MLLLIDNYDSFTYNLVHYLGELGSESVVVRNDKITVAEVMANKPKAIVLSPGPCTPNEAGICLDLIKAAGPTIPLLGVCLGHQSIGQSYGGKVIRAPQPMHGKLSTITNTGKGVFAGLPKQFQITRYHSLIVERSSACSSTRRASPPNRVTPCLQTSCAWQASRPKPAPPPERMPCPRIN